MIEEEDKKEEKETILSYTTLPYPTLTHHTTVSLFTPLLPYIHSACGLPDLHRIENRL